MKTVKDLAREMQLTPRSVRRWSALLNVPPTVPANSSARYSDRDAARLLSKWRSYWRNYWKQKIYGP